MKKWRIIRIIGAVLLLSIVVIIVLYISAWLHGVLTTLPYRYVTAVEITVLTLFISGLTMLKLSYRIEEKEKRKEKSGG
ncbi:MAG: hypothetical protein LUH43_01520 [Clostridia bacterium]|nr:hypothetical protein [Clostridia bacterium]